MPFRAPGSFPRARRRTVRRISGNAPSLVPVPLQSSCIRATPPAVGHSEKTCSVDSMGPRSEMPHIMAEGGASTVGCKT